MAEGAIGDSAGHDLRGSPPLLGHCPSIASQGARRPCGEGSTLPRYHPLAAPCRGPVPFFASHSQSNRQGPSSKILLYSWLGSAFLTLLSQLITRAYPPPTSCPSSHPTWTPGSLASLPITSMCKHPYPWEMWHLTEQEGCAPKG